jgi:FkbM family methyltransferase
MVHSIRYRLAVPAAALANQLLTFLRNGKRVSLSREEYRHCVFSFSQFGEDLIVSTILAERGVSRGIYVDVGAYHPQMFSNTLLLRKQGFRGVNIDMSPRKISHFQRERPEDWNVCAAVSDGVYSFETVDAGETTEAIKLVDAFDGSRYTTPLADILAKSPYADKPIDYLNIDCEGHDYSVLRSIPLETYRPIVITIEAFDAARGQATRQYLEAAGYELRAIAGLTQVFAKRAGNAG